MKRAASSTDAASRDATPAGDRTTGADRADAPRSEASPAAAARAADLAGIRLLVASMACFICNDAIVKLLSASLPIGQLILLRGTLACVIVFGMARASGAVLSPAHLRHPWVLARGLIDGMASLMYLAALMHMPLANATAVNMATPLFIVALAVPLLGERVGALRWAAIAAGFAGVLMIIQPRADGFNGWALLALAATLLHALRDFVTRRVPAEVPSIVVTLATAMSVATLAGLLSLFQDWQLVGLREAGLLACSASLLSVAYHLVIKATRTGRMSVIAPWRYSGLLLALVLGWALWGDVPNALAWAGIALLVSAGLYLIRADARH